MSELPSKEQIMAMLIREYDFGTAHALDAYERLARQPALHRAFRMWFDDRSALPTISAGGYSLSELTDRFRMTPLGAFLTLAWLMEKPSEARSALAEGFDEISL